MNTHMVYFEAPNGPLQPATGTESETYKDALLKCHQINKETRGIIGKYVVGAIMDDMDGGCPQCGDNDYDQNADGLICNNCGHFEKF